MTPRVALYVGGMGHRDKNFHKEMMIRRGFGDAADGALRRAASPVLAAVDGGLKAALDLDSSTGDRPRKQNPGSRPRTP